MLKTNLGRLHLLAVLEGISYILLLGVCMPLKYLFDMPMYTYPVGLAHGVLFVAYCVWVLIVARERKWSILVTLVALAASLFPFGTFAIDYWLLKPQAGVAPLHNSASETE